MIHHFLELLWPEGDEALSETAVGAVEKILTLKAELRPGALGILTTSLLYYSKQQQQQKLQRLLSLVSLVFWSCCLQRLFNYQIHHLVTLDCVQSAFVLSIKRGKKII